MRTRHDRARRNDPYRTGTHANDVLFIRPVFDKGRAVGYVTIKAHQLDIGGSVPGGFSVTKTSAYENGLVLSRRLLVRDGEILPETWSLIMDNARFGPLLGADILTVISCLDLGAELLQSSVEHYGADAVLGTMQYIVDADAERMTEALECIPDGESKGEGLLDAKTAIGVALKFLLDPDNTFTSGLYRCVGIALPVASIISSFSPDGVVFAYGEPTNVILTGILRALAAPLGELAIAEDYGSPNMHTAFGTTESGHPRVSTGVGGGDHGLWGATRAGDADSFILFIQVNGLAIPLEASEADAPVAALRRAYVTDTAGVGYHRGGAAVMKDTK
ncbi:MAG: hydantoinase B/oxoprolinase family protein [Pseudoclavibacter sp.]